MKEETIHFFAGGCAATVNTIVTSPLDVIQTRIQSSPEILNSFRSIKISNINKVSSINFNVNQKKSVISLTSGFKCLKSLASYTHSVIRTETPFALYKGLIPSLLATVPLRGIYFSAYGWTKSKMMENKIFENWSSPLIYDGVSGFFSGCVVAIISNPLWFSKTLYQLDQSKNQSIRIVYEIYQKRGLKAFFCGTSISLIGSIESMFYFVLYNHIRNSFSQSNSLNSPLNSNLNVVVSSSVAKLLSTFIMYPHEVIRTRMRLNVIKNNNINYSILSIIHSIYKNEKLSNFYSGFGLNLLKQIPSTVITFVVYENTLNYLISSQNQSMASHI